MSLTPCVITVTLYNNSSSHFVITAEWTGIQDPGPATQDPGPETQDPNPEQVLESRFLDPGDQEPRPRT